MTTDLDPTIRDVLGRMGNAAPPPPSFEELEAPVVIRRSRPRSAWSRRPAVLLIAAVLLVGGTLALLVDRAIDVPAIGEPRPATGEEWDAALHEALAQLRDAEVVDSTERAFISGHLASVAWFTWRPDGEMVVIRQTDIDVRETAWWLSTSSPLRTGERIETIAWVEADRQTFIATDDSDWSLAAQPSSPPYSLGQGLLDPRFAPQYEAFYDASDGARVSRRTEGDGTTVWTLHIADEQGEIEMRVGPDGRLAAIVLRQDRAAIALGDNPVDLSETLYTMGSDPEAVPIPEVGQPLDLAIFDLPSDFGIGP